MDELGKDYPKTDAEEVSWYKDAAVRLVDYARKTGIFDVPADYKLDVVETPPPLRSSIDGAAYYPAPPFKQSGVGRFYVTTSGNNDPAFELGNIGAEADFDPDRVALLADAYFGESRTAALLARVRLFLLASNVTWTLWFPSCHVSDEAFIRASFSLLFVLGRT